MQNLNDSPSPLSRLINDDNLTILENIIPHCNANLGKFLALCLKISEMQKIMEGFDDGHGIAPDGQEKLEDLISDSWEFAGELGKRDTGIIDIYMIAFELANKQLTDAEGKVC